MAKDGDILLRLEGPLDDITCEWTQRKAELHLFGHEIKASQEIAKIEGDYDLTDITALSEGKTGREWTGDVWQFEFQALETVIRHFLEREYCLSIEYSLYWIFIADFESDLLAELNIGDPPARVDKDNSSGLDRFR